MSFLQDLKRRILGSRKAERMSLPTELLAHYDDFGYDPDSDENLGSRLRAIRQQCAEVAAPNGGPATQLDNSGVAEGPPSVS
jgi:hypothetical protein